MTQVEPQVCKLCKTTILNRALTGKNKEKAGEMFQNKENTGGTIESITIVERINKESMKNNKIDYDKALEGRQEVIEEIVSETEQNKGLQENEEKIAPETANRELKKIIDEIYEEIERKETIEGNAEEQREKESNIKQEGGGATQENKQQETREADPSSAGFRGLEPIFYSNMTEEERIRIIDEALKEGLPDEEKNNAIPNLIPELDNIPPVLNDQAMQEVLNAMEIDDKGEDTCGRYESWYRPPHNSPRVNCRVCLMNDINNVFLPCRHASLCNICAETFTECPMCRSPIQEKFEIHIL